MTKAEAKRAARLTDLQTNMVEWIETLEDKDTAGSEVHATELYINDENGRGHGFEGFDVPRDLMIEACRFLIERAQVELKTLGVE